MVIIIKAPKGMTLRHLIKEKFKKLGFPHTPSLKHFLSVEIFSLATLIPPPKVPSFIAKSKTVHGVIFNDGPLLIHPVSAIKKIRYEMRKRLAAEAAGDFSKFGNWKRIPATRR